MQNGFITNYADYTDFGDYMQNSIITNYAGYADIQYYMKNNSITDYANYADFRDCMKIVLPLTTLTTLILETTCKIVLSLISD